MSSMNEQQVTPGKRAAQGRATRGQLIEVATRLFAENGYEGTSIEAVLTAAGVSRGALYHHFAGKEALFEAVVSAVTDQVTTELAEVIRASGPANRFIDSTHMEQRNIVGDYGRAFVAQGGDVIMHPDAARREIGPNASGGDTS